MTCAEQPHGNEPLGGLAPSGLRVWGKFAASRQVRAAPSCADAGETTAKRPRDMT